MLLIKYKKSYSSSCQVYQLFSQKPALRGETCLISSDLRICHQQPATENDKQCWVPIYALKLHKIERTEEKQREGGGGRTLEFWARFAHQSPESRLRPGAPFCIFFSCAIHFFFEKRRQLCSPSVKQDRHLLNFGQLLKTVSLFSVRIPFLFFMLKSCFPHIISCLRDL